MLGGDVPWEGSSRRLVSLQAPCHVKSTCVHGDKVQPSCLRERVSPSLRVSGRRSQGRQTVERGEQLTCRGAWLLQLGLAASSTRSVCPASGFTGDASPALRPLEIDVCLRAIDSVSIDLWSRLIRERLTGRDLTGG